MMGLSRSSAGATIRRLGVCAAVALLAGACGSSDEIDYSAERGLYRPSAEEIVGEPEDYLQATHEARARGEFEYAYHRYRALTQHFPGKRGGLFAREGMVHCRIGQGRSAEAHEEMVELVRVYKEYLLTKDAERWASIRDLWYRGIAMRLFYTDEGYARWEVGTPIGGEHFQDDLDPAVDVLKALFEQEPTGRYAARCLLRIGDAEYRDGDFEEARARYLIIVEDYPGYGPEREEALFKAAYATLLTMKGAQYDIRALRGHGASLTERGALDLCENYRHEYPRGRYRDQIVALERQVDAILAYRIYNTGRVYERLGYDRAAGMEYLRLEETFGESEAASDTSEGAVGFWLGLAREQLDGLDPEHRTLPTIKTPEPATDEAGPSS